MGGLAWDGKKEEAWEQRSFGKIDTPYACAYYERRLRRKVGCASHMLLWEQLHETRLVCVYG